jgi:hypothetical protein
MISLKLLIYLFTFKSNILLFKTNKYQISSGNDDRYPVSEEKITIEKIVENYHKKNLLDYLQSNKISIHDKINKLNEFYGNGPQSPNLLSGGLQDEWNNEN